MHKLQNSRKFGLLLDFGVVKIENIILNNEAYYFLGSPTQFLLEENHNPRKKNI